MMSNVKPERLRISLSIDPTCPAYAMLAACHSLAERRATAVGMLNSHAAALLAGLATQAGKRDTSPALSHAHSFEAMQTTASGALTSEVIKPGKTSESSPTPAYSREKSKSLAAILDLSNL